MARIVEVSRCPYPNPISVKYADGALENGMIVGLDKLETGSNEVYKVKASADKARFAIVVASTLQYDETKDERDFVLKAGEVGRAYLPKAGDVFTIAKDLISGSPVDRGGEVEIKPGTTFDLQKKSSGTAIGFVRRVKNFNGQASVEIEFY